MLFLRIIVGRLGCFLGGFLAAFHFFLHLGGERAGGRNRQGLAGQDGVFAAHDKGAGGDVPAECCHFVRVVDRGGEGHA